MKTNLSGVAAFEIEHTKMPVNDTFRLEDLTIDMAMATSPVAGLNKMSVVDTAVLRSQLLSVNGIGPETADSILLYGLHKPVFVVDAYTKRIISRHGFIKEDTAYADVQKLFMDNLKRQEKLFNEYHALLVKLAKDFCRKSKPKCDSCPLKGTPALTVAGYKSGEKAG